MTVAVAISGALVAGCLMFFRLEQARRGSGTTQVRPRRVDKSKSIVLKKGDDLQAAIDAAQLGDRIVLPAGVAFESPKSSSRRDFGFALTDKGPGTGTDADYITIESSAAASLPPDVRVSPSNASLMPKIVANGAPSAVQFRQGAHHYRFIGIEFTNKDGTGVHTSNLLESQGYLTSGAPHHIVIDRCYIHPIEDTTDPSSVQRSASHGVTIDGAEITITNSYIAGFGGRYRYGDTGTLIDSVAFEVVTGSGPYRVINNYMEAWYANFFFGGGGLSQVPDHTGVVQSTPAPTTTSATLSSVTGLKVNDYVTFPQRTGENANAKVLSINGTSITFTGARALEYGGRGLHPAAPVPGTTAAWNGHEIANIEMRRNTFAKDPKFFLDKNNPKGYCEIKTINGLVIDGNIFKGWPTGLAFVSANQTGASPWSTVRNVTITNNIIHGFSAPFLLALSDGYRPDAAFGHNYKISNNLVYSNDVKGDSVYNEDMALVYEGANVQIDHNTVIGAWRGIVYGTGTPGFVFRDNIVTSGTYGMNCLTAPNRFDTCWPNAVMSKNVIIDNRSDRSTPFSYPGNNFYLTNVTQVGFVDPATGNYRLSAGSRFKGKATDGKDIGVDYEQLSAAIGTQIVGHP